MVAAHKVFIGMFAIIAAIALIGALGGNTSLWWTFVIALSGIVVQLLALRDRRRRE